MTLVKYSRPAFLLNRSPFEAVNRLQDEVQRLLEAPLSEFGSQFFNVWAPALDVYEDKENIIVKLEVPAVDGGPEITPEFGSSERPAGRAPPVTA